MKTRRSVLLIPVLVAPLLLDACILVDGDGQVCELNFSGTVTYLEIEGSVWALRDASERDYEPGNLQPAFEREGLPVHVCARKRMGVSEKQIGPLI